MSRQILVSMFLIFNFQQAIANINPEEDAANWQNQLRETSSSLLSIKNEEKQADLLKALHAKIQHDLNGDKNMESPVYDKRIVVFNRMNGLFLDKLKKSNCPQIKSDWKVLKISTPEYKFEIEQLESWIKSICR